MMVPVDCWYSAGPGDTVEYETEYDLSDRAFAALKQAISEKRPASDFQELCAAIEEITLAEEEHGIKDLSEAWGEEVKEFPYELHVEFHDLKEDDFLDDDEEE